MPTDGARSHSEPGTSTHAGGGRLYASQAADEDSPSSLWCVVTDREDLLWQRRGAGNPNFHTGSIFHTLTSVNTVRDVPGPRSFLPRPSNCLLHRVFESPILVEQPSSTRLAEG